MRWMMAGPHRELPAEERASPFAGGRAAWLARWLVVEMIVWPGLIGIVVICLLAYAVRDRPLLWPLVAFLLLALLACARQWRIMLRAATSPPRTGATEETSPRPAGRGSTSKRWTRNDKR